MVVQARMQRGGGEPEVCVGACVRAPGWVVYAWFRGIVFGMCMRLREEGYV